MSHFQNPPRGLVRFLARLPIWLYRLRLGRLLGSRFLLLTHRGRETGVMRDTVLEVIGRNRDLGTYFVASGWGRDSQWFRNVQKNPNVELTVGRRRFAASARLLPVADAEEVLRSYAQRNRLAGRAMFRLFGSNDPHLLSQTLPVVALQHRGRNAVTDDR